MKFTTVLSALAAIVATVASVHSVAAIGAQTEMQRPDIMVNIASRDVLDRATALLNKNKVSTDNNAYISRSNVVFLQNDRLAMRRRVMDVLVRAYDDQQQQQDEPPLTTATVAKRMLRALSAPTSDAGLLTKASGVVAAASSKHRDADLMVVVRVSDLVDAVGLREIEQEDTMRPPAPRGVRVLVGTKDPLREPSSTSKTTVTVTASDDGDDKPRAFRVAIVYDKNRDMMDQDDQKQEQWGAWGAGYGLGWRYPLSYWNAYGAGFYGGGCGLGFASGPFYYC